MKSYIITLCNDLNLQQPTNTGFDFSTSSFVFPSAVGRAASSNHLPVASWRETNCSKGSLVCCSDTEAEKPKMKQKLDLIIIILHVKT